MVKVIGMIKRKPGMTIEEFSDYWYKNHAPLVLSIVPGVIKYVQNHILRLSPSGEPKFDGAAEIWFEDLESWQKFRDWYRSDDGKALREDEERFLDASQMVALITEERVIKP